GQGGTAQSVHSLYGCGAYHLGSRGPARAEGSKRRATNTDAWREFSFHIRRCQRTIAPHAAVLRDSWKSCHVQGRLDRVLATRPNSMKARSGYTGAICTRQMGPRQRQM